MKKKHIFPILAVVAVVVGMILLQARPKPGGMRMIGPSTDPIQPYKADPENPLDSLAMLTFDFDGRRISLKEGRADEKLPGYGEPWLTGLTQYQVSGDLNGDGIPDAAAVMVSSCRGVIAKFLLVASIRRKDPSSKSGILAMATNTVYLGEDILPDQLTYVGGGLDLRFFSRGPNEPRGTPATWVREYRFTVKDGMLTGVERAKPKP